MKMVTIKFMIYWCNGRKSFELMKNLPRSVVDNVRMTAFEETSNAFTIDKSPELKEEYEGFRTFSLALPENEHQIFEKFVGAQCERIKDNYAKLQDSKIDFRLCEMEEKKIEITREVLKETKNKYPMVRSVEAIIYLDEC